ncbi:MAG: hypothetical protein ACU0BF_00615 [Paracoccaceae bacterium]
MTGPIADPLRLDGLVEAMADEIDAPETRARCISQMLALTAALGADGLPVPLALLDGTLPLGQAHWGAGDMPAGTDLDAFRAHVARPGGDFFQLLRAGQGLNGTYVLLRVRHGDRAVAADVQIPADDPGGAETTAARTRALAPAFLGDAGRAVDGPRGTGDVTAVAIHDGSAAPGTLPERYWVTADGSRRDHDGPAPDGRAGPMEAFMALDRPRARDVVEASMAQDVTFR